MLFSVRLAPHVHSMRVSPGVQKQLFVVTLLSTSPSVFSFVFSGSLGSPFQVLFQKVGLYVSCPAVRLCLGQVVKRYRERKKLDHPPLGSPSLSK